MESYKYLSLDNRMTFILPSIVKVMTFCIGVFCADKCYLGFGGVFCTMVLSVAFFKQKEKVVIWDLYSTLIRDGLRFH